jgi:hypothetical protein
MPTHLPALLPLLACLAACSRDAGEESTARAAADSATSATLARTAAAPGPPVALTQERDVDLTGDRAPELVRIAARGTRPESLAVTLTVRDSAGATLHRETWSSGAWLARIDPSVLTPAIADSLVRRRIDDVLGDGAVVRPATVDPRAVARDVAERTWRRGNGLADALPLPAAGLEAVQAAARDTTRVRALVAERRRQPALRWMLSDGHRAIAWSPTERRFVRVEQCC